MVPAKLLATAQAYTGASITGTLRIALERLNDAAWSRKMLELEDKVRPDLDRNELREHD